MERAVISPSGASLSVTKSRYELAPAMTPPHAPSYDKSLPRFLLFLVLLAGGSGTAVRVATITDPDLTESSGVAASHRYPGSYWTHNDSGDGPRVFLFDFAGIVRAKLTVAGAGAVDW